MNLWWVRLVCLLRDHVAEHPITKEAQDHCLRCGWSPARKAAR